MTDPAATNGWHLDKRVPVALLCAIVAQFIGIVWIASTAYERLQQHERRITTLETETATLPARLARIELLLERIDRAQQDRIERQSR